MVRWGLSLAVAALMAQLAMATPAAAQCVGDCDGDGEVGINELITAVNLALGGSGECEVVDVDSDGDIEINELIGAVNSALDGCEIEPATLDSVRRNYAAMLYANYSDALLGAEAVQAAVDAFVAAPTAETLAAAKQAWLDARPAYLQTEMARFYGGPIDDEDDGPEGLINAWPLDEAYIDYVEGDAEAGIVNQVDLYPVIDADLLVELNEGQSETTISTGWHAIEFLLWGQDQSDDGPGGRPFNDYVTDGSGTASNQARRGDYLKAAAELLVEHISTVRDDWAPSVAGNYRAEFESVEAEEAMRRLMTGMGTLSGGELTGERLAVAYDTKDQEDEHSCFSDNTHVDHRNDLIGIQNVFYGRYGSVVGPGLQALCATADAALAEEAGQTFEAAREAVFDIPVPFDQAILGDDSTPGRQAIAASIDALNAQTLKIAECADALGIPISTTLP